MKHETREAGTVIYGINAVLEALRAGAAVSEIHLATNLRQEVRAEIEDLARERGVTVLRADRRELDRQSGEGVHQGVVALGGPASHVSLDALAEGGGSGRRVLLCLDEVQDVRNLGALARSALAFGAAGLVLPERRSAPVSPAAIKASAGALCYLPVARVKNLARALERLKKRGYWVTGAVLDPDAPAPWELDPGERVALVLGSEGGGLRRGIASQLDHRVRVPMGGQSESLNVSVAGAVLLYEWLCRPARDA
ncbi:MAG: 23S rRNA (guanosine(2251)-2'-O)-methyltransferase RlmB [Deltaproteobacteria bacterium]|nr:23S rRNA (guanosine(2251)-2'-O)-methyltransferase RlmB [Deltaproteobacteria bacterium]